MVVPAGDLALSLLVEQLREGLRESERRMATLVANLPGMAYRCGNDPDWTMEFISQGCTALTGYPPSVLLGNAVLSYNDLVLSEERKWLWDQVQSALARREPFQVVYHIRAADGVVKTVWEQGRGVLGEAGELVALEGFITDVTERADSEDALRTGEEKLRAVVTASPLAVVFIDSDEIARLFNPAAEQVFGWKAVVVLGHPWPAVSPGREEEAQALSRRWTAGETLDHMELVRRRKDGTLIDIAFFCAPVFDRSGVVTGSMAIIRDITEEKRVRRQVGFQAEVLAQISDAVVALDEDGRVAYWNKTAERIFEHTEGEVLGRAPDGVPIPLRPTLGETEVTHVRTDGMPVELEVSARVMAGEEEGPKGMLVMFRDVTERNRVQTALLERDEQLHESERLKALGELAGGIAHDFNNLLTAIMGNCELALGSQGEGPAVREELTEIKRAAERASSLTR